MEAAGAPPQLTNVVYDSTQPLMDREQIDGLLLMVDEEEESTEMAQELFWPLRVRSG